MPPPGVVAPVVRESVVSWIARELRAAIIAGALAPGAQLVEAALCAQLRVSRGPLREAVQRLVQEGLMRAELNRGVFVSQVDDAELRDLYLVRAAVEQTAVAFVIENDRAAAADVLEQRLREASAVGDSDRAAVADADLEFHRVLVTLSGSPRLRRWHETLLVETRRSLAAADTTSIRPSDAWAAHHRGILGAIRAGDLPSAHAFIAEHLEDALRKVTVTDNSN